MFATQNLHNNMVHLNCIYKITIQANKPKQKSKEFTHIQCIPTLGMLPILITVQCHLCQILWRYDQELHHIHRSQTVIHLPFLSPCPFTECFIVWTKHKMQWFVKVRKKKKKKRKRYKDIVQAGCNKRSAAGLLQTSASYQCGRRSILAKS